MGLDITAYSNAVLLPPHERDDACYDDHVLAFAYECFPRSFRGMANADETFDFGNGESVFIGGRCYDVSKSKSHAFRGGSYSGYNFRRNQLSLMFLGVEANMVARNPEQYEDKPFFELVNFADNEGCIGPGAAADLLRDFEEGRERWKSERPDDLAWYDDWTTACRLAADDGLISFH